MINIVRRWIDRRLSGRQRESRSVVARVRAAHIVLFAAGAVLLSGVSSAAPTAVVVCKRVASNNDANLLDGGTFSFGLNDQTSSIGTANLTADETSTASAATCATSVAMPGTSTQLSVNETVVAPATWVSSPSFPTWIVTDATHPVATPLASGSGQTATLTPAQFATASGTVTVTFTNRRDRRLTVCAQMLGNGDGVLNQGSTLATINVIHNSVSTPLTGFNLVESGDANSAVSCSPASISLSSATLSFGLSGAAWTRAPGYVKYVLTQNSDNAVVGSGGAVAPASNPGATVTLGGSGDVTLTILDKVDAPYLLRVCKRIENSPGYTGGPFRFGSSGNLLGGGFNNVQATVATASNNTTTCGTALSIATTNATWDISEDTLPANFPGFAPGYPKWELYADDGTTGAQAAGSLIAAGKNRGTGLLASGASGEWARIDWSQVASGRAKLVFVNAVGSYGNGSDSGSDSGSNTGQIIVYCKALDVGVTPSPASFNFSLRTNSTNIGAIVGLSEGAQNCNSLPRQVKQSWWALSPIANLNVAGLYESANPAGWPGDAPGYPFATLSNSATAPALVTYPRLAFISPTWRGYIPSADYATPTGDFTYTVRNKSFNARTIQFCYRLDNNGIAPVESSGLTNLGTSSAPVTATEGGPAVCTTPEPLIGTTLPYYSPTIGANGSTGGNPGMAKGYPYVEYTDSASPGGTGCTADTGISGTGVCLTRAQQKTGCTGQIGGPSCTLTSVVVPNEVFSNTTGNIKVTYIGKLAPRVFGCKQLLNNGDSVDNAGTFGVTALVTANAAFSNTSSIASLEDGSTKCGTVNTGFYLGWTADNHTVNGSESLPAGFGSTVGGSTPGYPKWEMRGSNIADPAGNVRGGVFASGSGSSATPQTYTTPEATGDISIVFINRAGPNRFVRFCSEIIADSLSGTSAGSFGLTGASLTGGSGSVSLGTVTTSPTEGNLYTTAATPSGVCAAQIDITTLDASATALSAVTQTVPPGWVSAAGYPTWRIVNSLGVTVANGTGAASLSQALSPVGTPNFDVVFTNAAAAASLTVTKTVTGGPAGGVTGTFGFSASCTMAGTVTTTVALNAATTGSATLSNLPAGDSCTVTETSVPTAPAGYAWGTATYAPSAAITLAAGSNTVTVTNPLALGLGSLTVTKTVSGGPAGYSGSFPISVACTLAGNPVAGITPSATQSVTAGTGSNGTVTFSSIPQTSTCTVSEGTLPTPPAGYGFGAATITQPAAIGASPASATVANVLSALTGSLTISKTITGAPVGYTPAGSFSVYATCSLPAAGTRYPATGFVSVTTTTAGVISGIPAGAVCTFVEDAASLPAAAANYAWSTPTYTQPTGGITAGNTLTANVSNAMTANPGTLTVTKTITPAAPNVTGAFPFTVACSTPTAIYNGTVNVTAGNTGSTTVAIPAGSTACNVVETVSSRPAAPAGYAWAGPTHTQPAATAMAAGGTASASMHNALQSGTVLINKTVTMPVPQAITLTFTLSCTPPVTTPATVALGSAVTSTQTIILATNAIGGSVAVSPIAAGSTCEVTETAPTAIAGYQWGTTPAPAIGLAVVHGSSVSAAFSNDLRALVAVSGRVYREASVPANTVDNGNSIDPGLVTTISISCTNPVFSATTMSAADGSYSLPNVPSGASCTLTETQPAGYSNAYNTRGAGATGDTGGAAGSTGDSTITLIVPASAAGGNDFAEQSADTTSSLVCTPSSATAGMPISCTLTCTNAGPGAAVGALCQFTGTLPAGAVNSCAVPAAGATLAVGASLSCALTYVATTTSTRISGGAGADNDISGGALATAGNNPSAQDVLLIADIPTLSNIATLMLMLLLVFAGAYVQSRRH